MPTQRTKFELSPRLKLGVGRGRSNKILKISAIACLVLALFLAVNAVRLMFKNNTDTAQTAAPQVLGASDIKQVTQSQTIPNVIQYKVVAGDTLFNISQKYNINWATLATLNNLKSPFTLKPGQVIQIPQ